MHTVSRLTATELGCIRQGNVLFADLSFEVESGQALLIEGANGAGKSSLLRLIAGVATPANGRLSLNDNSINPDSLHYIGHQNGLRAGLTVLENLKLACRLTGHTADNIPQILKGLRLNEKANTQSQYLSAGQKRRAALARLLIIPRKIWILDEPFTALDANSQLFIREQMEGHVRNGGICIFTSHQPVNLEVPVKHVRLPAC